MGEIGDRIRELRGEMQQAELADKLSIHKNTMANYERGGRFPDVKILLKILHGRVRKAAADQVIR